MLKCVFFTIFVAFVARPFFVNGNCGDISTFFFIGPPSHYMVFDVLENETIVLEEKNLKKSQLWKVIPSKRLGLFNLVLNAFEYENNKALDVIDDSGDWKLTFTDFTDAPNQQWFLNSLGTITNGEVGDLGLSLSGNVSVGVEILLVNRTEHKLDKFHFISLN